MECCGGLELSQEAALNGAMTTYVVLLRGVNVGGKNKIAMKTLRERLGKAGFSNVSTYIASGNVILGSDESAEDVRVRVERALSEGFDADGGPIKALVLTRDQLRAIVDGRPEGFGDQPQTYHSDAIFLIGIDAAQAIEVFDPREGVDRVWAGDGVIYSQRLSAERTKSRLSKMMGTPEYKSMTIRNWNTTTALLKMAGG